MKNSDGGGITRTGTQARLAQAGHQSKCQQETGSNYQSDACWHRTSSGVISPSLSLSSASRCTTLFWLSACLDSERGKKEAGHQHGVEHQQCRRPSRGASWGESSVEERHIGVWWPLRAARDGVAVRVRGGQDGGDWGYGISRAEVYRTRVSLRPSLLAASAESRKLRLGAFVAAAATVLLKRCIRDASIVDL
jgi:hypothetical protein